MRKRDRKALGKYSRELADLLELRDWTVNVHVGEVHSPHHPDGWEWIATSESTPGQKRVHLTFSEDVRDWTPEHVRQTVAHELIHAHLAPLMEMIRVDLHGQLKPTAHVLFATGATRWMEFAVDALADAVAPRLPLIAWPVSK